MIIYNTTYLVADRQFTPWLKWLRETHIPYMLESGFTNPQVAKIISADSEQEGISVAVQFHIDDLCHLQDWEAMRAEALAQSIVAVFGTDVLMFSTTMELM